MGNQSVKITYSMRETKIQKISRREKTLKTKPLAWLRAHARASFRLKKKAECIRELLETQFGQTTMEIYEQIKIVRSHKK